MTVNSEKFSPKLVFIAAGLLVFGLALVWFAYSRQDNTNSTDQNQEQTEQNTQGNDGAQATDAEKLYVIDEESSIVFKYPEDLAAVPNKLPEGFVSYLNGLLERNGTEVQTSVDCITGYTVSKFSSEIVRGGQSQVPSDSSMTQEECVGGGFTVWTANGDGVWGELYGGQERPSCSVLEDNDIPPEFEEDCLGENGDGPFFNPLAPRNYETINL